MKFLYAIVHAKCLEDELSFLQSCKESSSVLNQRKITINALLEINKIKNEEKYVEVFNSADSVDYEIPQGFFVRVCGAYGDECVARHLKALERKGIPCRINYKGVISLIDSFNLC